MTDLVCAGELLKLGGGALSRLQRRYFELRENGALLYFDKPHGDEKGAIYVEGAKVIDRGTFHGKQCFSIEGVNLSKGVKEYFLFADDPSIKWMWFCNIQRLTRRYDYLFECEHSDADEPESPTRSPSKRVSTLKRIQRSVVYERCIRMEAANQSCADCGASVPTWSVVGPHGVFVCIECIGVHRGLWSSYCKEIELDRWSEEELAFMERRGNAVTNDELEFHVPPTHPKPNRWSDRGVREFFITAKYRDGLFSRANHANEERLHPVSDTADRNTHQMRVKREMIAGAPPKYVGVALLTIDEAQGMSSAGAVAVVTNGFQEVRSRPATKSGDGSKSSCWRETLQIGVDHPRRQLSITVYESDSKIAATAELAVQDALGEETNSSSAESRRHVFSVPLAGPSVNSNGAYLVGRIEFMTLT